MIMDTIIFCWIAPVCAIISGFLLAFFQKRQKSFGYWYTQNQRIIFKAGITLVFLTALIFGYLGSMKGFESDDSSFWLGICGIAAMILLFYIGFSTGYHLLIKIFSDRWYWPITIAVGFIWLFLYLCLMYKPFKNLNRKFNNFL